MNKNYTREIVVSSTPDEAYKALTTGFNRWWTADCNTVNYAEDKITFKFGPSFWVMRATNLVPGKIVELECIDAHHVHDGLPSSILNEWKGSKLKWEIQKHEEKTKIVLVHEGLVPTLECYEVCERGWDYFFVISLKEYLDTGEGSPFEKEA
ncbi:MAG: SRPBCC domain-containing protein [Gammaproteobacteria bacterium]|nr:SRPBCC domain-containing protein [Gammaproteobacteria bacterium]MDH5653416.1 SRPBCC domain-containing protein [Gammaproteobacteria bacterium]